jgi:hypothetical protein
MMIIVPSVTEANNIRYPAVGTAIVGCVIPVSMPVP